MTLTEIRNTVIARMTAQTAIAADAVDYPNGPVFDPSGRGIWVASLTFPAWLARMKLVAGLLFSGQVC
jgi:hypothetical protein